MNSTRVRPRTMSNAIEQRDLELMKELIGAGYELDGMLGGGKTNPALHEAAMRGFVEGCQLLISAGASISHVAYGGATPLHEAARRGRADVCALLINAGAEVDAAHSGGVTALQLAAVNGEVETIRLLLERGADVNAPDRFGDSALRKANSYEAAKALLAAGADPNQVNEEVVGRSTAFQGLVATGSPGPVRACLETDLIDVAQKTNSGKSLLQLARSSEEIKELLRAAKSANLIGQSVASRAGADETQNLATRSTSGPSVL